MSAPKSDAAGIRQTIRALRNAGHTITAVDNGGDEDEVAYFDPRASEDKIVEEATATDEAYLYVMLPNGEESWVRFVLGNEPYEVICDHAVDLSPVLDPLTERWNPDTDD